MNAPTNDWIRDALSRYWPQGREAIEALPVVRATADLSSLDEIDEVPLPPWGSDCGVDGVILIPRFARRDTVSSNDAFKEVDWWSAAAWFLNGSAERAHETASGPIHSYAYRLGAFDARVFERAWVNRIALFLRRWAADQAGVDETRLFGPRPTAEIALTHDVDAILKTFAIRFKQSAFRGFRAARLAAKGELQRARSVGASAVDFAFRSGTFDFLDDVARANEAGGFRGTFFIHARGRRRSATDALFDPGYRLDEPLCRTLRELAGRGHRIGVHPSYSSWGDAASLARERAEVSRAAGVDARSCRQHWLRFSWGQTWRAQEEAGFESDSTLAFNDRPGFRVGAALRHRPWNQARASTHALSVLPLVVMDSHLYDYAELEPESRTRRLRHFVDEIRAVGGEAAFLWHPHTLSPDYGWRSGYEEMLAIVSAS